MDQTAEAGPEARRETQQTLIVILSTVALDAVGIGLIMPVLPGLLRNLVHSNDVTAHYGILLALYALMRICLRTCAGRAVGSLGRRPVLLVSLAGAAVDYAVVATASSFGSLYRAGYVAGITGATRAVAGAYLPISLMAMSARGTSAS